jgi:hypothetical protein
VSLCAIRGSNGVLEFFSYTTATLVSGNTYTLSGLARGLYGTPATADHVTGSQFVYLGGGEFFSAILPPQYVGHNLWLKFPSFNLTAGGGQSLAAIAAYAYTPQGAQLNPNQVTARFAMLIESGAAVPSGRSAPVENF